MAKTFDYETAWLEVALPAFKRLSGAVHLALAEVATAAAGLSQLADYSVPWPEDGGKLRELFDRIESADLATAAQVVHNYGHWYPSGSPAAKEAPELPGRDHGVGWKFAHYADQVLRERLELPARGDGGRTSNRVSYQVHEGQIRVCYSSPNTWTWHEVAPATAEGLEHAHVCGRRIGAAISVHLGGAGKITRAQREAADNAAYQVMRAIEAEHPSATAAYMIEESAIAARKAARMPPPDRAKLKREREATRDKEIRIAQIECAGFCWLIDHGFPTDNAIFYSHTGRWAFGWRQAIAPEVKSAMLDQLSEFPGEYDFVTPKY